MLIINLVNWIHRLFFPVYFSLVASFLFADQNTTELSELDLAKRDAQDFRKLAELIKPSVVVIESVDRNDLKEAETGFVVREDGVLPRTSM